jgi:hypothetical protein
MNPAFLEYLDNDTDLYPSVLAQQFPHIFNQLVTLIGSNQFSHYLNDILFDTRGGRQGFPPEVVSELWKLQWHSMRLDAERNAGANNDYWSLVNKKTSSS